MRCVVNGRRNGNGSSGGTLRRGAVRPKGNRGGSVRRGNPGTRSPRRRSPRRAGRSSRAASRRAVDGPAVVVAFAVAQCGEVGANVAAERFGRAEVHRRAGDAGEFARGNQRFVGRQPARGAEPQLVAEHRSGILAREVPVGVVRQVDDRGGVARGFERLANPVGPPCRWLGPLLTASRYSLPSSVKRPPAIRLAKRPGVLPKQAPSPT